MCDAFRLISVLWVILHPLNSLQFKCELNVLLAAALCATDGQITALGCCNAEENLKTAGF